MTNQEENVTQEAGQAQPKAQNPLEEFIDYQRRALEETGKAIEALLPPDFVKHAKEAQKESLAGFKVLADTFIAEMEKVAKKTEEVVSSDDDKPSTTGNTKVKVQVD